mmetsp:Transcript_104202/g.185111  ORF Transcript_104202/g.185111 Transcript_104202/m.185111 type:complete len:280 (-) Transcript_104202:96-935(-)
MASLRCVFLLSSLCLAVGQLHLVEPSLVICSGGPGKAEVVLAENELSTNKEFDYYMLSFFWKAHGAVSIDYELVDARNVTVIKRQTLNLEDPGGRRLNWKAIKTIQDIWATNQMIDIVHNYNGGNAMIEAEQCGVGKDKWKGTCGHCLDLYEPSECQIIFKPPENMTRHDAKQNAFVAGRYYFPMKLRITRIAGPSFSESAVCANHSKKAVGDQGSIFVILSEEDPDDVEAEAKLFKNHPRTTAVMTVLACVCCCGTFGGIGFLAYYLKKKNEEYDELK